MAKEVHVGKHLDILKRLAKANHLTIQYGITSDSFIVSLLRRNCNLRFVKKEMYNVSLGNHTYTSIEYKPDDTVMAFSNVDYDDAAKTLLSKIISIKTMALAKRCPNVYAYSPFVCGDEKPMRSVVEQRDVIFITPDVDSIVELAITLDIQGK